MRRLSARDRWATRLTDLRDNLREVRFGTRTIAEFLTTYSLVHKLGVLNSRSDCI